MKVAYNNVFSVRLLEFVARLATLLLPYLANLNNVSPDIRVVDYLGNIW
jgi:hypothetical protein